jgi:hypothetical protein
MLLVSAPAAADQGDSSHPGSIDRGSFGPFERSLNVKAHGYAVIADPTGTAPTRMVERFEVRPGDCHFNAGWNDCESDRERSELGERGRQNPVGSTAWYGWWLYIPDDWINVFPTKVALGQFHQVGSHPVWMFQNDKGGLYLDDHTTGRTRQYHLLIGESELRGRWHRIEVHAHWTREETGFLRVWVNGEQRVDYSGPTMTAKTVYFKYGVYRSFLSRYLQAHGNSEVPAQIAYFAGVKRARSRDQLVD